MRLKWVEQGGPPVSAPIKRGFGTTLIEQSARSEGGDAHMSIEAQRDRLGITIPLPRWDVAGRSKPGRPRG